VGDIRNVLEARAPRYTGQAGRQGEEKRDNTRRTQKKIYTTKIQLGGGEIWTPSEKKLGNGTRTSQRTTPSVELLCQRPSLQIVPRNFWMEKKFAKLEKNIAEGKTAENPA